MRITLAVLPSNGDMEEAHVLLAECICICFGYTGIAFFFLMTSDHY